jgi:hypothetical protein
MHSTLHVQVVGHWCVLSCLAGHKARMQLALRSTHTTYTCSKACMHSCKNLNALVATQNAVA